VVALVHDVVVTMGFFALTQLEFDLNIVAAVLTIIGYSLNDKVVIDDRIRENLRKYRQMDIKQIIDLSVNETLPRTVMTSVTLLAALIALLFLGPEVIFGFTAAMVLGIVVGTYSSIFVSSSLLITLGVKQRAAGSEDARAKGAERIG
jgi:preprotein translocase subunit SecF